MTDYRDVHNKDWLKLASNLNGFINFIANRDDLVANVTPHTDVNGKAHVAAGYFISEQAAVYFDASKFMTADDDPTTIDPFDDYDRIKYIDLIGVAAHEAAHAAHTDAFDISMPERRKELQKDAKTMEWFMALEESRIEKMLIDRRPRERDMLRGSISSLVKNVVLEGKSETMDADASNKYANARIAVLILARVDAGTLEADDFKTIREEVEDSLGSDLLEKMSDLWSEAHEVEDGNFEEMLDVASRFAKLLEENDVQTPEMPSMGFSCGADYAEEGESTGQGSQPSNGAGQPGASQPSSGSDTSDSEEKSDDPLGDALRDAMEASKEAAKEDVAEEAANGSGDNGNPFEKALKKRLAEERDRATAKNAANEVFPDGDVQIEGKRGGSGWGWGSSNLDIKYITPTAQDLAYARGITNKLRKAQYRDVARSKRRTDMPPGKVRASEIMRRDSQIARKTEITATPWTRTSRRVTDQPPITLGISFDVSGSLGAWVRDISAFSWSITQALRTVKGKVASVAWDTSTRGIIAPGRFPSQVPVIGSGGGTTAIVPSLNALEGALQLCSSEGVRMLVILTDGEFSNHADTNKAIDKFVASGVQVVYCHIKDRNGYGGYNFIPSNKGVTYVKLTQPSQFATVVGDAMVKALKKHKATV